MIIVSRVHSAICWDMGQAGESGDTTIAVQCSGTSQAKAVQSGIVVTSYCYLLDGVQPMVQQATKPPPLGTFAHFKSQSSCRRQAAGWGWAGPHEMCSNSRHAIIIYK